MQARICAQTEDGAITEMQLCVGATLETEDTRGLPMFLCVNGEIMDRGTFQKMFPQFQGIKTLDVLFWQRRDDGTLQWVFKRFTRFGTDYLVVDLGENAPNSGPVGDFRVTSFRGAFTAMKKRLRIDVSDSQLLKPIAEELAKQTNTHPPKRGNVFGQGRWYMEDWFAWALQGAEELVRGVYNLISEFAPATMPHNEREALADHILGAMWTHLPLAKFEFERLEFS